MPARLGPGERPLLDELADEPRVPVELVSTALMMQRAREVRRKHFQNLRDRELDLLLTVFIANQEARQVATAAACKRAGLPIGSGLRGIGSLEAEGLIQRFSTEGDRRVALLKVTELGRDRLCAMLQEIGGS